MAQIREIKKRMGAVKTIERITKTMQMIATAKFTSALQRAKATQPYTETIRGLVRDLAGAAGDLSHPLMESPSEKVGRQLILVISSDRGLCGAYNATNLRTALHWIRAVRKDGGEVDLETAGKKAVGFFTFQKIPILEEHSLGDKPAYEDVDAIASRYIAEFAEGKYDSVSVAFMRFITNSRQVPEVRQILPISPEVVESAATEARGANANYEFSPSGPELMGDLLPLAVKSQLFQAFTDALVSEQIMRMIAMKAASENAGDIRRTLSRDFNRARQAQITTELTEIIGGTAALE